MNPQVFIDTIEQAVSPVRASDTRKDRMREELAAHLAASWQEECGRDAGDAPEERVLRRLGPIDELTRSLQDSVPRLERWLFMPLPGSGRIERMDRLMQRGEGETPFRHAARITAAMVATLAALELVVIPLTIAIRGRGPSSWPTTLLWAAASLAVTGIGCMVLMLLDARMVGTLQERGRSRRRQWLLLAFSSLIVVGLGAGFAATVSIGSRDGMVFAQSDWLRLGIGSLIAPVVLALSARESLSRGRRRRGWGLADLGQ